MGTQALEITELRIAGYEQDIGLRLYRRANHNALPVMLYFHGGAFVGGTLDDADFAARYFAEHLPALVISVDYSLAPKHPFPAALEDAYCAARWATLQGREFGGNGKRLVVAGHKAGGQVANGMAFIARDRGDVHVTGQALFGPMLDPSMTRLSSERRFVSDGAVQECAAGYRAYLPKAAQRVHPYAAPLESCRLTGLPATLIATGQNDVLHVEAEQYASCLIGAGVRTQVIRYASASNAELAQHEGALRDAVHFLQCSLVPRAIS